MVVYKMLERASCMELVTFATIILSIFILFALSNYFKQVILAFKLKGPKALPFIGNVLMIANKHVMTQEARTAYETYGPITRIWVTFLPAFAILDPEHIQSVLASKKHTDKIFVYKFMHNFLGKGLITSAGEKWQTHRKLIQPSFHLSILEKFISTFSDGAQSLFNRIEKQTGPINITEFVNNCVLDVLNETVFGVPINVSGQHLNKPSPFRQGKIVLPYRVTKPWLMFDWVYQLTEAASSELNQKNKLDDFTRTMIAKRRLAKKSNTVDKECLLDYMIDISDNNKEFTEEDIINEASTFMLAGQDSVGASVAFTLFLIAKNLEDQKLCIEELDKIFGTDSRSPTMSDLREMKYLEQCIKESLRLYPSVPLIARKTTENIKMGDVILPNGSDVFFLPYATHRIPHIYPEPEKFDPDRFSPENSEKRHPFAYIPFSAGPRNCIGYKYALLEMKTIISKILRNFTLHTIPGKEEIIPSFRITLRAQGGLWIKFKKRERSLKQE